MKQYMVTGGIYKDFDFQRIDQKDVENYGPFDTYEEASKVWKANMWQNVDNALHKLKIIEYK